MKVNLNGRNIEVTIWQKDDDEYMYYIGSQLIGSLKTSAMQDENIILKPKTKPKALIIAFLKLLFSPAKYEI